MTPERGPGNPRVRTPPLGVPALDRRKPLRFAFLKNIAPWGACLALAITIAGLGAAAASRPTETRVEQLLAVHAARPHADTEKTLADHEKRLAVFEAKLDWLVTAIDRLARPGHPDLPAPPTGNP